MSYLRSFGPWLAYFAGTALADWRLGLTAGLVVGVVLLMQDRPRGIDLISLAGTVYFAAMLPIALLMVDSAVRDYTPVLALGTLGVAATASIIVGKPFSSTIAKRETPEELWETDVFLHVNVVITAAWAASFLVSAAAIALVTAVVPDALALRIGLQVLGFVVPVGFTAWYRARITTQFADPIPALQGDPS